MACAISKIFFTIELLVIINTAFAATDLSPSLRNVDSCGVSKILSGLIVRGKDIRRGEFPWIVPMLYTAEQPAAFFCSGTLVSSTFVLSTANCFQSKFQKDLMLARDVIALFGAHNLNNPTEVEKMPLSPDEIILHEDWNSTDPKYNGDIALLRFAEGEINVNSVYINPICIWDSNDERSVNRGVILGWGRSEDPSKIHENVPKIISIAIESLEVCFFKDYKHLGLIGSPRSFCGFSETSSGVCSGDTGGGLVVKIDGIYYLEGILSTGTMTSDGDCDIERYSLYTNIHKYLDWIKLKTEGAFATKNLNELICSFRKRFSYHHAQRVETCVIESTIDSNYFAVGSEINDSVINFYIRKDPETKFLPRHAGERFPNLEELVAHKCGLSIIRKFYFDNMRRLQFMDLSFNQITVIERNSFKDLFNVKYLFLGNNRIERLDFDLFKVMIALKDLDLAHNRIKSLVPTTFKIPGGKLLEVNLLSNVCIDGNYEAKDFTRLEADARFNCSQ